MGEGRRGEGRRGEGRGGKGRGGEGRGGKGRGGEGRGGKGRGGEGRGEEGVPGGGEERDIKFHHIFGWKTDLSGPKLLDSICPASSCTWYCDIQCMSTWDGIRGRVPL